MGNPNPPVKSLSPKGSDPLEASRFSKLFTRLAGEGQTPLGIGSKDQGPKRVMRGGVAYASIAF